MSLLLTPEARQELRQRAEAAKHRARVSRLCQRARIMIGRGIAIDDLKYFVLEIAEFQAEAAEYPESETN